MRLMAENGAFQAGDLGTHAGGGTIRGPPGLLTRGDEPGRHVHQASGRGYDRGGLERDGLRKVPESRRNRGLTVVSSDLSNHGLLL